MWNTQAWRDKRKLSQSMKTDTGKSYRTFCISSVFWNIQLSQFLSRTERVWSRKWKAVAEVVQLKQRERDFLPWKLYLFYTNYLLTFDQQLLEHLFQVLQEKKIIFKSAVEVRTRWQGMTISHFSHYALGPRNKFLSSIVTLKAKHADCQSTASAKCSSSLQPAPATTEKS